MHKSASSLFVRLSVSADGKNSRTGLPVDVMLQQTGMMCLRSDWEKTAGMKEESRCRSCCSCCSCCLSCLHAFNRRGQRQLWPDVMFSSCWSTCVSFSFQRALRVERRSELLKKNKKLKLKSLHIVYMLLCIYSSPVYLSFSKF